MGEGAAPKSEMQRGCGEESLLTSGDRHTKGGSATEVGWGRAVVGTGRDRGPPGGGSALQQCGASDSARSLYSVAPRVPAPFPAPRSPTSSLWPGRPHAYANLERAWARPLMPPQDQDSPLLPPQVLDGIWVGGEYRKGVGAKWKDNPRETQQTERKADIC